MSKIFKDLDLMVCGDVANTNIFDSNDKSTFKQCQKMYEEQVKWAKEACVDFVIAETINWTGEMEIALKAIRLVQKFYVLLIFCLFLFSIKNHN